MVGLAFFATLLCLMSPITCRKTADPNRVPKDAVLLSKVASLTLRNGRMTSSRRVNPIPQLTCIDPKDVCKLYSVDVMRCTNDGADYDDKNIQWVCKANLPEEFKLGSTDVVCEGYQSSEDPYILKGSCGVEYRLMLTDKGEVKYGSKSSGPKIDMTFGRSISQTVDSDGKIAGYVFGAIFAVVLLIILRGIWLSSRNNPPRLGGGYRPNGGGGSDDDAPPPYDGPPPYSSSPRSPRKTSTKSTTNASSSRSQGGSSRAGQQEQWRPGFWTGAAAGAAGAYAAGLARNRTRQAEQPPMQQRARSSWFGDTRSDTRPNPPTTSFSSMPSPSIERQESTGFGGTRRR